MVTIVFKIQHIYTNNSCSSSQGLVLKYNLWKFSWENPTYISQLLESLNRFPLEAHTSTVTFSVAIQSILEDCVCLLLTFMSQIDR